jgi:hypothetical protein
MPLYIPGETVPPMYPPRKAVLYVVDEATGKTYPVKVTVYNNSALLPVSVEHNVLEGTVKQLDSVVIVGGSASEFVLSGVSKYSSAIVTVRAVYNASATQGVRVRWLYSADNTNYDGVEDAEDAGNFEDLTFSAGATRQRTLVIPLLQPYTKVQVVNKDTSYSVTVSCWTSFMR